MDKSYFYPSFLVCAESLVMDICSGKPRRDRSGFNGVKSGHHRVFKIQFADLILTPS